MAHIPVYRCMRHGPAFCTFAHVPKHSPCSQEDVSALKDFIEPTKSLLALTGAGISTESGLPDYRSKDVGVYERRNYRPVLYQEFLKSVEVRRRYWSRNFAAWPTFSSFEPNVTHRTLKAMEDTGRLVCVITQNVDRLHTKAGSRNVVELHGSGYSVKCLSCDYSIDRHSHQKVLQDLNPHLLGLDNRELNPDGDVAISQEEIASFVEATCPRCNGILKPDIVFFGDSVPPERLQLVRNAMRSCDALLILGTSLTAYSSYRIAMEAIVANKPTALVNIGASRADGAIPLRINARCGEILPKVYPF